MIIDFHQGIVTYPASGSIQQFLAYQGGYVTLSTSNGRVDIVATHGVEDYLHTESTTVSQAWGPITPGVDAWLYWDINTRSAVRTFGITYVQPVFGSSPPNSPVNDQHWFDVTAKQMKVYNSALSKWVTFIRVFACKINNGVFSSMGSNLSSPYAGTQAGLTSPEVLAGRIIVDVEGKPIRRANGSFFTTEDEFFVNGSPVNALRLESVVQDVTAGEPIAANQIVKYTAFGEVLLATYNDTQTTAIAISLENIATNEAGIVGIQGVITNPNWAWAEVGIPLWIHGTIPGYLTDVDPHVVSTIDYPEKKPPVARVLTPNTVFFDQGLGGLGMASGEPIDLDGYVLKAGDTMSGNLSLPATQNSSTHATTKGYVDSRTLAHLADVTITSPADLEVLQFNGIEWVNAPLEAPEVSAVGLRQIFTATEGQITFTGLVHEYVVGGGQLTVYINGIQQYPTSITELSTTSFALAQPVNLGDKVMAEVSTITPPYIQPPTVEATGYKQLFVANPGQTVFGPLTNSYVPGGGLLTVFINGIMRYPSTVTELSPTTFEINDPADGGEEILAVISDITPPYIYPPPPALALDSLTDVSLVSPADGDVLRLVSGSWQNGAETVPHLFDLADTNITSPTQDEILTYDGTNWVNGPAPSGGGGGGGVIQLHTNGSVYGPTPISTHAYDNVVIGVNALVTDPGNTTNDGTYSVVIGTGACENGNSPTHTVAVGYHVGQESKVIDSVMVGSGTGMYACGYNNIAIGKGSMQGASTNISNNESSNDCIAIGQYTLTNLKSGMENVAIGSLAGNTIENARNNILIGYSAGGYMINGSGNVAVGSYALQDNNAAGNTAVGDYALTRNTTNDNTAVGSYALGLSTTGPDLTAVGSRSLQNNTSGGGNTAIGSYSGSQTTVGNYNTSVGAYSLLNNISGQSNTVVGHRALFTSPYSEYSVAIGADAARNADYIGESVAIGYKALESTTDSGTLGNTAVGHKCMMSNRFGSYSTGVGAGALQLNTDGYGVTAVGANALISNTTGSYNVAVGYSAGYLLTVGENNIAIGYRALQDCVEGSSNVAIGALAMDDFTGDDSIGIGEAAMGNATTGLNNIAIGHNAGTDAVMNITTESHYIVLGNNNTTNANIKVAWTVTSDARDKTDIVDIPVGLSFVKQLAPKQFKLQDRTTQQPTTGNRYGFIAQDILPLEGDTAVLVDTHDPENLKLKESMIVPVLVKAIQELAAEVDHLKTMINNTPL